MTHLHHQGDDHGANFSQRTAQIAGQAPVDGHQDYLGSPIQSYVHGGSLPGDLLTILSTIHPTFLSVFSGDGFFILPLTTLQGRTAALPGRMALLGYRR